MISILIFIGISAVAEVSPEEWEQSCNEHYQKINLVSEQILKKLCHARAQNILEFNLLGQNIQNKCTHPLVLLGENHDQNSEHLRTELSIASLFPIRGTENVDRGEFARLKKGNNAELVQAQQREALFTRFWRWLSNQGSGLKRTTDSGFYISVLPKINGHSLENLMNDPYDKSVSSAQWALFIKNMGAKDGCEYSIFSKKSIEEMKSYFSDIDRFLSTFESQVGKKEFPIINFDLESEYLDVSSFDCTKWDKECMKYVMTARNHRMLKKILKVESELPCGVPLLIIVGAGHIGPLTKLLADQNFSSTASSLSILPYIKYKLDPELPNE